MGHVALALGTPEPHRYQVIQPKDYPGFLGRNPDPTGKPQKETFHPAPLSAAQLVTHHPRPFHLTLLPEIRCTSWYSVPALPPQSDFTNCRFALVCNALFCPPIRLPVCAKHTGPLRIRGPIRDVFGYIDDYHRVGGGQRCQDWWSAWQALANWTVSGRPYPGARSPLVDYPFAGVGLAGKLRVNYRRRKKTVTAPTANTPNPKIIRTMTQSGNPT